MIFGKRNSRPVARPVSGGLKKGRLSEPRANGPETPIMEVAAMKRALLHAAWRDPSHERKKNIEVHAAVRTIETTAAYVDQAIERLREVQDAMQAGQNTSQQLMRGLLAARVEELLDSLNRLAKMPSAQMASENEVNLLIRESDGLFIDFGHEGFRYVLPPIDIRRGPEGLNIPFLHNGFEDASENFRVEAAVKIAEARLAQFAARLSHDASMLVTMAKSYEADISMSGEQDAQILASVQTALAESQSNGDEADEDDDDPRPEDAGFSEFQD